MSLTSSNWSSSNGAPSVWHPSLRPINRSHLNELVAANDMGMSGWEGDISDITWVWCSRLNHPGQCNTLGAKAMTSG